MNNLRFIQDRLSEIQLFFLYGSMKSGTTWLQLLLDVHPSISCRGEGHFTHKLAPFLADAIKRYNAYIEWKNVTIFNEIEGYPQLTAEHFGQLLGTAILLLMDAQSRGKAPLAIGEKTPDTINALPLLGGLFPQAKFIHIVRDGRDCAVSGWFHNQRTNPEWLVRNYDSITSFISTCAREWAKEVQMAAEFQAANPERCLTLRYEDLLVDTEQLFGDILHFLAVPTSPEQISACCAAAAFSKFARGRAPGQEDRASFFRKGVAGDWRNHFTQEMEQLFQEEAGAWLKHFGYNE